MNEYETIEPIELPYVTIYYVEPVVHLVFKEDAELGFPEIRELTRYAEQVSGHNPYLIFSDARANVSVTPEGRKLASDAEAAPLHRGTAVLVNKIMLRTAANFFYNLRRPKYPYRAFTDKQKALDWLEKIKI